MSIPLYPVKEKHEPFVRQVLANLLPPMAINDYWDEILYYQEAGPSLYFLGPTEDKPTFYVGCRINRHDVGELEASSIGVNAANPRQVINALCRYYHETFGVRKMRVVLWDGQKKLERVLKKMGFAREFYLRDEEYNPAGELINVVSLSKTL